MAKIIKSDDKNYAEIAGLIKVVREKAILFHDGNIDVWVPISQIENEPEELGEGAEIMLLIPEWLAKAKDLV